jgi:hypothetical protein
MNQRKGKVTVPTCLREFHTPVIVVIRLVFVLFLRVTESQSQIKDIFMKQSSNWKKVQAVKKLNMYVPVYWYFSL